MAPKLFKFVSRTSFPTNLASLKSLEPLQSHRQSGRPAAREPPKTRPRCLPQQRDAPGPPGALKYEYDSQKRYKKMLSESKFMNLNHIYLLSNIYDIQCASTTCLYDVQGGDDFGGLFRLARVLFARVPVSRAEDYEQFAGDFPVSWGPVQT
ncbi:hypothetical protein B0H11DRAFT_1916512 [Mycena galericulata]|nr:hypothetical protein B0H11DRAFT_1916512 [Mycena galericulata]